MMSDHLATAILNRLLLTGDELLEIVYSTLMGSWPAQTFVTLYIVIVGYLVIMGRTGERTKEWALSVFLLLIVGGIAMNAGSYASWVAEPIHATAMQALSVGAQSVDGGSATAMFDALEEQIGQTMAIIDNINMPGNFITNAWLYIKVSVVMAILALLALALYLAALALVCIAFFSLFMMLLAGGPCLWLVSFKETRHITWAWLRSIANYTLWLFFLGLVVAVGLYFLKSAVADLSSWDLERDGVFNIQIGGTMFLMALTVYMLLKASDWAAALTGGSSTNTGVIGAMGGAAGGAIGGAMNWGGGLAKDAAKWSGGVLANKTTAGAGVLRAYSALRGLGKVK